MKYELTNRVLQKLTHLINFKFIIDIDLDSNTPIPKNQRNRIVDEVVEFCIQEFSFLQNMERASVYKFERDLSTIENSDILDLILEHGFRNLPRGINEIFIQRWDDLDNSFNSQSEGGPVKNMSVSDIESVVSTKEEKMLKYQTCEEYWLIIIEGNYYAGTFSEIEASFTLKTKFNRVFVYRSGYKELITLK